MFDLAILGGGPAGLSAAIYAVRKLLNTCVVSLDIGGQILLTGEVENYLGFELISAPDLVQKFQDQVNQFHLEQFLGEKVVKLESRDGRFLVATDQGRELEAKSVLVATGKRSRRLGVTGEPEFSGRGVSYCSTCDAPFFKGNPVAVVGGGNSAFEAAVDNLKMAPTVYLVNTLDHWQSDEVLQKLVLPDPKLVPLLRSKVKEIRGGQKVSSIVVDTPAGEKQFPVGAVFVEIGLIPNSEFTRGLLTLNPAGEIMIDCECQTNVPGVFAAGDVTTVTEKQIIVAAGEGAKAGLGAYRWLITNGKL